MAGKTVEEEKKLASSRMRIGILMAIAGVALSALSVFSAAMIVGLIAGPLIFLTGIVVAGHSLQRLLRIRKERP